MAPSRAEDVNKHILIPTLHFFEISINFNFLNDAEKVQKVVSNTYRTFFQQSCSNSESYDV